jgi:hypothetical protein
MDRRVLLTRRQLLQASSLAFAAASTGLLVPRRARAITEAEMFPTVET